jgi:hypothetical protein
MINSGFVTYYERGILFPSYSDKSGRDGLIPNPEPEAKMSKREGANL